MKISFLNVMLSILGAIGLAILILSMWFIISIGVKNMENITFKFNLLCFLTGISYILFVVVIFKIVKK